MLIRDALSDAQWLIAKGGTDRAEVLNRVLGKIDDVLKELDGAYLVNLNKVWHQAKDVMPPRIYGGNHADLLCVHQFKPNSHPHLTQKRTALSLRSILKRVRMTGGVELVICSKRNIVNFIGDRYY